MLCSLLCILAANGACHIMAESSFSTSNESLPLSQETFNALLSQLPFIPNFSSENETTYFTEGINEQNLGAENEHSQVSPWYVDTSITTITERVPSSLPASSNWSGPFAFKLSFPAQEDNKGDIWTYSCLKNKLYVKKDAPCPITFSSNLSDCSGVYVRAMALFTSSQDCVHRCPSHSHPEWTLGVMEADHLVRCSSKMANYIFDPVTSRHSVVVPYESPPPWEQSLTLVYKFMCLSSCSGGPNRRPMMLVFTLEKGNEVFGRQRVDIKICANPSRDRKVEERKLLPSDTSEPLQKKIIQQSEKEFVNWDIDKCDSLPMRKKNSEKCYTIKVQSSTCYNFLNQVVSFLNQYGGGKPSGLEKHLRSVMGSSEEELELNDGNIDKRLPLSSRALITKNNFHGQNIELMASVPERSQLNDQNMGHIPSVPESESWCGPFSFSVSLSDSTKKNSWTYSKAKNKLYVGRDVRCPISFASSLKDYSDVYIRTVALFRTSTDIVHCCITHSLSEHVLGVPEAEHFVRCESNTAMYLIDRETKRHSVAVPLERPPAGQGATTYIFKFACLGSCAGGPNRRPLMLVFTLEKRNEILGRQVVDLKVCVCPDRDKMSEEKQLRSTNKESSKRKFSQLSAEELAGFQVDSFTKVPTDNFYTLKVKNEQWYRLLSKMKIYYEVYKNKSLPEEIRQYFQHIITSSSDERDE